MTKFQPVRDYENEKEVGFTTVFISIIAAVGINIFVAGLASTDANISRSFVIIGMFIILISLAAYCHRRWKLLKRTTGLNGFFVYNAKTKKIINIPRYGIVERMWIEMESINHHNPELSTIWKNSEIGVYENTSKTEIKIEYIESESDKIIRELLEYFVLEELSLQLISLCNLDEKEIKKLERDDVPDLLKSNRILNWLSMEKGDDEKYREFLLKHDMLNKREVKLSKEELAELMEVTPMEPYSRFEMFLPKDGIIRKRGDCIIIEHPSFCISIEIVFTGSSALLPKNFKQWYLGIEEQDGNFREYQYGINIDVRFKWWTMFLNKNKKYYRWIDRFILRMDDIISEDSFFQNIGWETASTVFMCIENKEKKEKEQEQS